MDDFADDFPVHQRHRNGQGLTWNKEDDQRLASLWPHNSAGVISKIMLPPRTKNAVIGRAHRIGLAMKKKKGPNDDALRRKHRVRRKSSLIQLPTADKQPKVEIAIDPQGWAPIGVPLLEAGRQHCRAVIESAPTATPGNAIFCGHPIAHRVFSFCLYHMELFTESAHGRRRSQWRHWKHARK